MADAKRLKYALDSVEIIWGKYPQAKTMADRFARLVETQAFLHHLKGLRAFREGMDPIPNRDAHEGFLRAAGHDFAVFQVLPQGGILHNLLFGGSKRENYIGLHGIIAARLLASPAPLSQRQVVTLYDTIDRVMRGGADWERVTHVPSITAQDYRSLRRVRDKHNPSTTLHEVTVAAGKPQLGEDYGQLCMVHFAAIRFIGMAVAVKNGHSQVSVDDGWEAAEAYLKLFEVNLLDLPPLVRKGPSGYESA